MSRETLESHAAGRDMHGPYQGMPEVIWSDVDRIWVVKSWRYIVIEVPAPLSYEGTTYTQDTTIKFIGHNGDCVGERAKRDADETVKREIADQQLQHGAVG